MAHIVKGEAIFTIEDKNYAVRAGDLMYLPPMTLRRVVITGNETCMAISIFAPLFDGKDKIYIQR